VADNLTDVRAEVKPKLHGKALDGSVLKLVGLGMADGQLEQADRWLEITAGRLSHPRLYNGRPPLVVALEHLRSACGWLTAAAEHP